MPSKTSASKKSLTSDLASMYIFFFHQVSIDLKCHFLMQEEIEENALWSLQITLEKGFWKALKNL